ncbi:MAG: hypothetical protein MUC59_16760 [Saprospiraceae bacterium]|jgi:hypothetical protein|nr:hypothetical protein [Saprospiraceae bacterium]
MQLVEQIRARFHHSFLEKEMPKHQLKRASMYLDNASSIGILFDGTEPAERETVLDYAEQLKKQGKKVKLLAFFNNKLKGESFAFPAFNRLQTDWALRPNSREALEFVEQPFDLLLNITKNTVLPLDYLAAHSKARFRVGPFTEKTFCYDLMIDLSGKSDLKAFLQQVVFYLKKMRPTHEAAAV